MAKNNAYGLALMRLVFQNQPFELVGDAAGIVGSATAGNLYIAAHTAAPEVGGNQSTNEANFTSYQRVAVARGVAKWGCDLVDAELGPARALNLFSIAFPSCTGGSSTVTHMSVGLEFDGPGIVLYSGQLQEPRIISAGIRLIIDPGDLILTED